MRCDRCQGKGRIWYGDAGQSGTVWEPRPCEDCQGSGLAHCCDGLCEQPSELRHTGMAPIDTRDDGPGLARRNAKVTVDTRSKLVPIEVHFFTPDHSNPLKGSEAWPLEGSPGLYDPIDIHKPDDK